MYFIYCNKADPPHKHLKQNFQKNKMHAKMTKTKINSSQKYLQKLITMTNTYNYY